MPGATPRLLVFTCHEPWIAQLDGLGYVLDLVVGLPGRSAGGWDARARPLPAGATLVTLDDAAARGEYRCVIVHGPADLLEACRIAAPRLLVLHNTLEGRVVEEGSAADLPSLRAAFARLVSDSSAFPVAISPLKAASWSVPDGWLRPGLVVDAYGPHVGSTPRGLRVANHIQRRPRILQWSAHVAAFGEVPVTIVGENPGWRGVQAARSFQHLKDLYRAHRFYVHTADPVLEDGYNLASLEAMASGLPVLGTRHPSSVTEDGITGFASDDAAELQARARGLLSDPALAARLGEAGRAFVRATFPHEAFASQLARAIEEARRRWRDRDDRRHGARA